MGLQLAQPSYVSYCSTGTNRWPCKAPGEGKETKSTQLQSRQYTTFQVWNDHHSQDCMLSFSSALLILTRMKAEQRVVLHRQTAIIENPGKILDMTKKKKAVAAKSMDDLTVYVNLSSDAMVVLQSFSKSFLEISYNSMFLFFFVRSILIHDRSVHRIDLAGYSYGTYQNSTI